MELHVECDPKSMPEIRHEFGAPVRSDVFRNSVFGKDVYNEEFCKLCSCDVVVHCDKDCLL